MQVGSSYISQCICMISYNVLYTYSVQDSNYVFYTSTCTKETEEVVWKGSYQYVT